MEAVGCDIAWGCCGRWYDSGCEDRPGFGYLGDTAKKKSRRMLNRRRFLECLKFLVSGLMSDRCVGFTVVWSCSRRVVPAKEHRKRTPDGSGASILRFQVWYDRGGA